MTGSRRRRTGRPLEAERHGETGGDNAIPRSLGLTLEALRDELGVDEPTMLARLLARTGSPYRIRTYSRQKKSMEQTVRSWETGRHEPQFGILHRYGLMFDTWSGVLHLVSLFCADLRDAADVNKRSEKLGNIKLVADRLAALAQCAKGKAKSYSESDAKMLGGEMTDDAVRDALKALIHEFLAAYRSVKR